MNLEINKEVNRLGGGTAEARPLKKNGRKKFQFAATTPIASATARRRVSPTFFRATSYGEVA
jgi:hypothetical protein